MTEAHDYSAYKEKESKVGDNLMGALTGLVDQLEAAEAEVVRLNELLSEAKANVTRLSEKEIPDLVDGLEGSLNLPDGRVVTVKEHVRCSAAGERKVPALKWLDANGYGAIIKRKFTIEFGKDQEEWASKFEQDLKKMGGKRPLNVKREKSVHPQTLLAFVKEKLEEGVDIPKETFGVFRQRIAKVKD